MNRQYTKLTDFEGTFIKLNVLNNGSQIRVSA